jgi:hypothetical protein
MNDKFQLNPARSQSSAVVSAALITTMGAVTAACIQSGWILRPSDSPVGMSQPTLSRTTFMEPDRRFEIPVLPPQPATRVTAQKPAFESHLNVLRADVSTRAPASDLAWSATTNPLGQEKRSDPRKSSSKFWDWSAVTRFFSWNF